MDDDYEKYDDDVYEGHDISENVRTICDDWDIVVDVHDLVGYAGFALSDQNPGESYTYISSLSNHVAPFEQNKHGAKLIFELVYRSFASCTKFEYVCPLPKAPIGTPRVGGLLVCIKKTDYPQWEEEFIFVLEEPPTNEELQLEVISSPLKGLIHRKEESMGHANISVADIVSKKRINKTYNLENGSGSVHMQVQWRTSD
ncbi:C2 domain-containing protein [Tanacetum coccineum]